MPRREHVLRTPATATETDAVGIVRKRYMQPTATHVEALTENFLDGEFDPPPSPPENHARGDFAASLPCAAAENQLSMRISLPKRPLLSREQRAIRINGEEIAYTLQRSTRRRRTIQMQLDPDTGFKVLVPHTLTDNEIEEFLLKRSDWILEHRPTDRNTNHENDLGNGGTTMLRGKNVQLIVQERDEDDIGRDLPPTVAKSLEGDTVAVIIPPGMTPEIKSKMVRQWLTEWYRQEAWDHFRSRIDEFGTILGVKPRNLKLSNAKRRWGSCSGKQSINLNWRLIMLEDRIIDYVVVHELAHLIELNHSKSFWKVVERVFPDHKELRRRLRQHSPSVLG